MMQQVFNALSKLHPRALPPLLLLVVAALAFSGGMLLLRKPYAEYQKIVTTRASLSSVLGQAPEHSSELERLASELKRLSEKLRGELNLAAADDTLDASLMKALDHSASLHGIALAGVKPGGSKQVSLFEETSFEVGATGPYLQLCAWMLDFEKTLGNNATITEFAMKTIDEGRQVALTLNIALYRPLKPMQLD